jgi:hypothetical protein
VKVAITSGVIKSTPTLDSYDTSYVKAALLTMTAQDTLGTDFQKGTVEVTPGAN